MALKRTTKNAGNGESPHDETSGPVSKLINRRAFLGSHARRFPRHGRSHTGPGGLAGPVWHAYGPDGLRGLQELRAGL
jgi:hypothetical protein